MSTNDTVDTASPSPQRPRRRAADPLAATLRIRGRWSEADRLLYSGAPAGAVVMNVDDKELTSPLQGFGKLWRKQYRMRLDGIDVTPEQVVHVWKKEFGSFWPWMAKFYGTDSFLSAGDSALINLRMGGITLLSTGVLVLFEDDRSFTFMTPEGHVFAAWITFSAERVEGATVAQVEVLIRASDPLFEMLMAGGGKLMENYQWRTVLRKLGARLGAAPARPTFSKTCVDRHRQWQYARNLRANAALRTFAFVVRHPRGGRPAHSAADLNRQPPAVPVGRPVGGGH